MHACVSNVAPLQSDWLVKNSTNHIASKTTKQEVVLGNRKKEGKAKGVLGERDTKVSNFPKFSVTGFSALHNSDSSVFSIKLVVLNLCSIM